MAQEASSYQPAKPKPRLEPSREHYRGLSGAGQSDALEPVTLRFQNSIALAADRQREVVPPQYRTFVQYTSKR
jgi:hypothetical protein